MPGSAHTPALALRRLEQLSSDVHAAVITDPSGGVLACTEKGADAGRMAELTCELLDRAGAVTGGDAEPAQVEVIAPQGAVFVIRHGAYTVAVVAGRLALPSLMFYDLRSVLHGLNHEEAA